MSLLKKTIPFAWLVAGACHAQVVQYNFTDTNGVTQNKSSASTSYLNPVSAMDIMTVAGLDRKVHLTIKSGTTTVFDQTSSLITVSDRLTDKNGTGFYGKTFPVPSLTDGTYTATSTVLDANGATISINNYTLKIDRAPPTSDEPTTGAGGYQMNITSDVWEIGVGHSTTLQYFYLNNIQDGSSGIASITAKTYREDGSLYATKTLAYNTSTKAAALRTDNSGIVPPDQDLKETLKIEWTVTDIAGNTLTKSHQFKYDNYINPHEIVGVYDPDATGELVPGLTGFVPYVPGMTVKTNPIKLAWRLKKEDYATFRRGGLSLTNVIGTKNDKVTDDTYVYVQITSPYGNKDIANIRWVNFGSMTAGTETYKYDLQLDPAAPQTPVITKTEFNYSDTGYASTVRSKINISALPITVDRVRFTVKPREYAQEMLYNGALTCSIPAGSTSCDYPFTMNMAKGTSGLERKGITVRNTEKTLFGITSGYSDIDWNDEYPIELASYTYDENTKILTAYLTLSGAISVYQDMGEKSVWLEDGKTGTKLNINPLSTATTTPYHYVHTWDLSKLPSGSYQIVVAAEENHGLISRNTTVSLDQDTAGPVISVTGYTDNTLDNITNLVISLTDDTDSNPTITSVTVTGGPIDENLTLGFSKNTNGTYKLEAPRLFPSLDDTQNYVLTIEAQDAQSNKTTYTKTFQLTPANLVALGTVNALPVNQQLLDSNNKPLTYAKITAVKTATGATATGAQQAYFTLRSDAKFAVVVAGSTIQPGENKEFTLTLDNTGVGVVPIYPAVSGIKGDSSFMIDIPQLVTN